MEDRGRTAKSDCRFCTSFSEFTKTNKHLKRTNTQKNDQPLNHRTDCPIDKDQLGSCSWAFLHTMATKYPEKPTDNQKTDMKQFLTLFAKLYPCEVCAEDFQKEYAFNRIGQLA